MDGLPILRPAAVFWLQILVVGCGNGQEVAEVVAGLPPIGELGGVRLDMAPSDLTALRPGVKQLEDVYYGEDIGGYEVLYIFSLPFPVLDHPDLLEVRALARFESESEARAAWDVRAAQVLERLGEPTECRSG